MAVPLVFLTSRKWKVVERRGANGVGVDVVFGRVRIDDEMRVETGLQGCLGKNPRLKLPDAMMAHTQWVHWADKSLGGFESGESAPRILPLQNVGFSVCSQDSLSCELSLKPGFLVFTISFVSSTVGISRKIIEGVLAPNSSRW